MKKILRQYHKIFPKKFGNYWKKNKSILDIDNDLKEITNNFVQSKSYNFVSSYWHHLNIESYKSFDRLGQKKEYQYSRELASIHLQIYMTRG